MGYLVSILLLLCTSCIQIGSDPQPTHHYLLASMPETSTSRSNKKFQINIEQIKLADYLDRLQIVTGDNNNGIDFSNIERWAEPLQSSLTRILCENLTLMFPEATISVSPWENSKDDVSKIKLMVNKFHGTLGNQTHLDIRWLIVENGGQTTQGHFTDRQPIGNNYRDLVVGLNSGISNFSLVLAKELAGK